MGRFGIFLFATALTSSQVLAAETNGRSAAILFTAWTCSVFAELKGDADEQRRLFDLGYGSGQGFLDALAAGKVSREDIRANVPLAVSMRLGGPSPDFILGQIFEAAAEDAYDKVVKFAYDGIALAPSDYVFDDDLKASKAATHYLQANCSLIR